VLLQSGDGRSCLLGNIWFQIQAARSYTISQAKLREKSSSPSNQASDQPIPTIAVTAIKAISIGLQDEVRRAELDRSRSY
jgi:hypothetical protein